MLCFFICNDHVSDGICLRMCCDTFSDRKNISTWNKNNHSPRLTVPATVVTKRTQVTQQQHANAGILQVPMVLAQPPQLPTM